MPLPSFGKRESRPPFSPRSSVPPKSLGGMFGESLFGKRPVSKPEQKPQQPQPKPQPEGLFGKKPYRTFQELKEFARKAPYESIPGTSRRLTQKERVDFMKELQKRGSQMGQAFGLSKDGLNAAIKQMEKEKTWTKTPSEKKALEDKIKMYRKWM